jgi:glycosyltransferase involved in cell wall biosynthesis
MTEETHPEVSIVIPCLNEDKTIGRCIEAALHGIASAGIPGEIIVADNDSTDR